MIKANQIRIGNVFIRELKNSHGLEYDPHFIITEDEMGKLFGGDVGLTLQDLFPVPITDEILERCGFEKDREGDKIYQVDPAIYIKLIIGADGIVYPHYMESTPEDCNITALKSVQHLHELQNLFFALTGTELVIKSFSYAS